MNKIVKSILSEIPDKTDWNTTTSLQMKKDLIEWCGDRFKNKVALEIGSHIGQSTMILGLIFKEVYTININPPNLDDVSLFEPIEEIGGSHFYKMTKCDIRNKQGYKFDNVYHIHQDAYSQFGLSPEIPEIEVSFIDALHTYDAVSQDIESSIKKSSRYIVFDDYGLYPEIKRVVDDYINLSVLKVETHIGWEPGTYNVGGQDKVFHDREGLICSIV